MLFALLFLAAVLVAPTTSEERFLQSFEQWRIDLDSFLPVVQQEIDFINRPEITDEQSAKQLISFFGPFYIKLQRLRELGLDADKKRFEVGENKDSMCGKYHQFYYLKLQRQRDLYLAAISTRVVPKEKGQTVLKNVMQALKDWRSKSMGPCPVLTPKQKTN